jgi:glycosyltransferase involved in cell wall biosynthesis
VSLKKTKEGGLRTKRNVKKKTPNNDIQLISVITVVFNDEKYLEQTIQSVVNQSYKNIEYIIIDGGSTDATLEIIKKYDSKIDYWISEPDEGIYDAMNKGIIFATGSFINFMNSGDIFFSSEIIEKVASNFQNSNIIVGNCIVNVNNEFLWVKKINKVDFSWGMSFSHQSSFIPASLQKQNLYDVSYRLASDFDFFYTFRKKIKQVSETISIIRTGGVSDSNRFAVYEEYINILQKNNDLSLQFRSKLYFQLVLSYLKCNFIKIIGPKTYVFLLKIKKIGVS